MKSFRKHLGLAAGILAAMTGLSGCQDNFDVPPLDIPVATMQANTTIAELKAEFWDDATNYATLVGKRADGEDYIVKGRVISSDATGNIYKSLVIQDETGALPLSINQNSLYNTYRIGQEVVLNVTDIYIGKYAGYQQMGGYGEYNGTPQTSFMDYATFTSHSELNGLPDPELTYVQSGAAHPTTGIYCLNADIASLPTSAEGLREWQGQLVVFRGVHFEGGGTEPYVSTADFEEKKSTSRTLVDSNGNSITVRNSAYATFAQDIMPAGTGDVRGILSYYNGSWQILLRTLSDVMFDTKGTQADPYSVEEAIEEQGNGLIAWTQGYIVGSVKAGVTNVGSNSDIIWGQGAEMDNNLVIGPSADTKDINKCLVVGLAQGSDFRKYGNLADNPGVYGKKILVYGTFEPYMGMAGITGNSGSSTEFQIEGVSVGGGGSTPSGEAVTSLFCNFDSYGTDIAQLVSKGGWTLAHPEGNRDWFLKEFSGNTYASANAYKATNGPWEMWLITPAIDIDKATNKTLEFISQAAYNPGSSSIEVYVLTSNDPKTAQKTLLNATFADVPASGYSSWVNSGSVDLSSFSGVIYIGWCYKANNADASTTYCIDDVSVGGATSGSGSGSGSGTGNEPGTGTTGAGSESSPYSVSYVQGTSGDETGVWVEGYVVGYVIGSKWESGATFSNDLTGVIEDSQTGYVNANFILGPSASSNTTGACIPCNLNTGVRDVLGFRSNPGIYLKHVKVKGDITKYFGVRGMKKISEYQILD